MRVSVQENKYKDVSRTLAHIRALQKTKKGLKLLNEELIKKGWIAS